MRPKKMRRLTLGESISLLLLAGRIEKEVDAALAAGKPVPPEVLADYPDLAPQPAAPAAKPDASAGGAGNNSQNNPSTGVDSGEGKGDTTPVPSPQGGGAMAGAASAEQPFDLKQPHSETPETVGGKWQRRPAAWSSQGASVHVSPGGRFYVSGDSKRGFKLFDRKTNQQYGTSGGRITGRTERSLAAMMEQARQIVADESSAQI